MDSQCTSVRLDQLDWEDKTFAIESYVSSDHLKGSISRCGILVPPWIWEKDGRAYIIVNGFKRLRYLREMGQESAQCMIFPPNADICELLALRVEEKLFGPALNSAEKARIVLLLSETMPKNDKTSLIYFPLLGIPPRQGAVRSWCRLAGSSEELLRAVASESVSERAAFELLAWEDAEALSAALFLFRYLRCSSSIQVEIIDRISEFAALSGKGRVEIFNNPELQKILKHSDWNHREKTQALRELLTRRVFPRLHAREERFKEEVAKAGLPGELEIKHPPAFEGNRWQIHLAFSSPEELRNLIEKTLDFADSGKLHTIMAPSRPEEGKRTTKA